MTKKGEDTGSSLKKMMESLLTNEGMLLFTLNGTADKRPFKKTKLYELIYSK